MQENKENSAPQVPGLELRYTIQEDTDALREWLSEPGVLKAFPMADAPEIEDSVKHWIGFARYKSSLTALYDGKPAGIATLCLMPYKKLIHQCLLSIIVGKDYRNKGVGTVLINNLLHLAKTYFKIEVVYLEVYEGNPAVSLYRRFGFKECGLQKYFMKDNGEYIGKLIMERVL